MAEVKAKYLKLGEKANFFYDPVTKLKVLPKQVIKVDMNLVSKDGKISNALKGGHLEYADANEYKAPVDAVETKEEVENEVASKSDLVAEAIDAGSELSKSKLKKLSVEELENHIEAIK